MLFIIINHTDEKRFVKFVNEFKLGFKVILHGKGTASSSLLEYFGLNEEDSEQKIPKPLNIKGFCFICETLKIISTGNFSFDSHINYIYKIMHYNKYIFTFSSGFNKFS